MATKLSIMEQDFITSTNKKLNGIEKVVACPMWLCKVNVKKNCGKCLNKEKVTEDSVICKYERKF